MTARAGNAAQGDPTRVLMIKKCVQRGAVSAIERREKNYGGKYLARQVASPRGAGCLDEN